VELFGRICGHLPEQIHDEFLVTKVRAAQIAYFRFSGRRAISTNIR